MVSGCLLRLLMLVLLMFPSFGFTVIPSSVDYCKSHIRRMEDRQQLYHPTSWQRSPHHGSKREDNEKATSEYRNNIYGLGTNEKAVKVLDAAILVFAVAFVVWSINNE